MSGGTLKDAKEMIGHKDISITDRYSHLTAPHMQHRQEQLAAHYLIRSVKLKCGTKKQKSAEFVKIQHYVTI